MPDPADIADESQVLAPRAALRVGVFDLLIADNPPGTGSYCRLRVQWRFLDSYRKCLLRGRCYGLWQAWCWLIPPIPNSTIPPWCNSI